VALVRYKRIQENYRTADGALRVKCAQPEKGLNGFGIPGFPMNI
jgi:hypothetical protein